MAPPTALALPPTRAFEKRTHAQCTQLVERESGESNAQLLERGKEESCACVVRVPTTTPTPRDIDPSKRCSASKTYQGAMPDSCTATLVHRNSIALRHDIAQSEIDHVLLEINRGVRITEWDRLRKIRQEIAPTTIDNIEEWTQQLQDDVETYTQDIPEEAGITEIDNRLLQMWQARQSLHNRWLRQKHNRTLQLRIARLDQDIAEYATNLTHQQWHQICDNMQGSLGMAKTWHLFKHLLDQENTKAEHRRNMSRLIHHHRGDTDAFLQELQTRYIGNQIPTTVPDYCGSPNEELDSPIQEYKVRAALQKLKTTSAPGADGVRNKTLRNLDDNSIEAPISLTSCIGKLFEHIILARLHAYVDDQDVLPHTMIGFMPGLSTQDVLLQIHHQAICTLNQQNYRAVTYNYVKAFLTGRTATLRVGDTTSQTIFMEQLNQIPGLKHSLYADDVTLWAEAGTAGSLEGILQEGIDAVQKYAGIRDMACSTEKSEYMVLRPPKMNLPREVRKHLLVSPLPKNMHPEYHDARRRDRCKHLHERYQQDLGAVYTDAADHATNPAMTMVVTNSQGVLLSGGSIATTSTEDAEETAIALALTLPNATTIISDSKRAVQNYARGRISRFAARILRDFDPTDTVSIVWAPAHSSLPGNDFAHNTARELAYRAAGDQEITQAYCCVLEGGRQPSRNNNLGLLSAGRHTGPLAGQAHPYNQPAALIYR
ncbi:hypothetical protein HPB47_013846 [Ixodes persulcatus]|uniref:Uncharacterized protein n=1 Tax=Ixodes persulcatus TaxID=34615 RepID=A0AC60R119_IXOPE|nr:hypothetical protein HPB47_013846 [Ixodes persulcatus]